MDCHLRGVRVICVLHQLHESGRIATDEQVTEFPEEVRAYRESLTHRLPPPRRWKDGPSRPEHPLVIVPPHSSTVGTVPPSSFIGEDSTLRGNPAAGSSRISASNRRILRAQSDARS